MRWPTPSRVHDPEGGRPLMHGGGFVFGVPSLWGTGQVMTTAPPGSVEVSPRKSGTGSFPGSSAVEPGSTGRRRPSRVGRRGPDRGGARGAACACGRGDGGCPTGRTVWRWLEQAKASGRVGEPVRQGYAVPDEMWELLGGAMSRRWGNVSELRRRLVAAGGEVPVASMSSLCRVICRDRRAGRALMVEREPEVAGSRRPDPLSEPGLSVVAEKGVGGQVLLREHKRLAQVPVLVPDAQVVHTPAVRSVLRTVARAAAVGAVVCLRGDAGQGPASLPPTRPSRCSTPCPGCAPGPGPSGPRRCAPGGSRTGPGARGRPRAGQACGCRAGAGEADLMLVNALRQPRVLVLVLDEAQRLPGPAADRSAPNWHRHRHRHRHRHGCLLLTSGDPRTVRGGRRPACGPRDRVGRRAGSAPPR